MTMKRHLILIALAACACDRQSQQSASEPTAPADGMLKTQAPVSKPPAVVPMPKDQAQLDRMILAGYTPHGKHLHPPGVKECPLAQGGEAVM
jgi:hypothetical protein